MDNLFKNTLLLDEKAALTGISEKSKKIVANGNDHKGFNRLLYNLNNGFHKQEKKFEVKNNLLKKQNFSSGFKNVFSLSGMKNSLKNIWDNGRKWFPLPRKWVSTSKNEVCLYKIVSVYIGDGFCLILSSKVDGFP